MPRADRLYHWLTTLPTPDAERILAAALADAEPPYQQRIIAQLFDRATDEACAALLANYGRLDPATRQRLRADPRRFRAGLTLALKLPDARTRCNALAALIDHPAPTLSYLLPDALRDSSDEVRRAAAHALRHIAETVVDELPREDWNDDHRRQHAADRSETAKAVWEALRTFDLHYRLEAVEISLWFVRDFGDDLWRALGNRRSECGNLAGQRLESWNSPRLARFLLEALLHQAWRSSALRTLREWSRRAQLIAILRNTDLLTDRELCRRLGALKTPTWFQEIGADLSTLPPDVRALAPRWVRHLGFSPELKIQLLSAWLRRGSADVQRACVYALAALDTPDVIPHLAQVAEDASASAHFARWWITGQQGRAPCRTAAQSPAPTAPPPSPSEGTQPPRETDPPAEPHEPDHTNLRRELRLALAQLLAEDDDQHLTAERIRDLRQLLDQFSAPPATPLHRTAPPEVSP